MMEKPRPSHAVLLTHEEKVDWFVRQIQERQRVQPFDGEEDLLKFLRDLRKSFRNIYQRDVPGYFIRKLAQQCGLEGTIAPKTKLKMNFAFELMDANRHFRENKTDLARAIEKKFGEKTLNYIIDDIWEEWHDRNDHPMPKLNLDIHGQEPLFE